MGVFSCGVMVFEGACFDWFWVIGADCYFVEVYFFVDDWFDIVELFACYVDAFDCFQFECLYEVFIVDVVWEVVGGVVCFVGFDEIKVFMGCSDVYLGVYILMNIYIELVVDDLCDGGLFVYLCLWGVYFVGFLDWVNLSVVFYGCYDDDVVWIDVGWRI